MVYDIRNVKSITDLINYFSQNLGWEINIDDFEDIEDISYDFDAEDIGLKEESFAKISSLRQLQPLVDGQRWGIFCVEFDSNKFEVSALRKILSGLIPRRRNSADHAVWCQQDLLFICNWGHDNNRTIGIAHFEDKESGLPQIKMISCAPALEDFTQIKVFEDRLALLAWPKNTNNIEEWRQAWSSAFITAYRQTIQDSSTLTIQLAAEAQNIRNCILDILNVESQNGYVHLLFEKFRNTLIHDMTEQQFADMYAQTVVYGLFSARCMDSTQDDFSAEKAIDCIPNTNPFLKNLMKECLGSQNTSMLSFDELEIGNVVDLLKHTKTDAIIADFNRQTGGGREDPVIHFYEEFLTAYDKLQKVQRGVYYTPQPVVNFIVRSVDNIIKDDFQMEDGLASVSTKSIKIKRQSKRRIGNLYREVEDIQEVPAIQVLDPATGTGTFIRQVILQIYENFKKRNKDLSQQELSEAWNSYVPKHLLPRINAFELMMAPYAVAHMKLAMVLRDTGYDFASNQRLNVYLTNSLEEAGESNEQMSFWNDPLALESVEANKIKKNNGINIVIGNPPYSYTSSNKGQWIVSLVSEYKENLNERKIHLDDDYVKFIRFAQYYVESSEEGIVAYITNNSFVDGVTHRVMRKKLLEAFEKIYVINLHGDSKKGETSPNNEKDENVFDIQQGVCITFMIKKKDTDQKMASVKYIDLYGTREEKNVFLNSNSINTCKWREIQPVYPSYFFVPKNFSELERYNSGFSVNYAFDVFSQGILSGNDTGVMRRSYEEANRLINDFVHTNSQEEAISIMLNGKNAPKNWDYFKAIEDIKSGYSIEKIQYRPFDKMYTAYTDTSCGWLWRPRSEVMYSLKEGHNNLCLVVTRAIQKGSAFNHVFVSDCITDKGMLSSKDNSYSMPLFIYEEELGIQKRKINFSQEFISDFSKNTGIQWDQGNERKGIFVFYYIYSCLNSAKYRTTYREMLTSEFPKIPYPIDPPYFAQLAQLGRKLIDAHLLRNQTNIATAKFMGDNLLIQDAKWDNNKVYINNSSFFSSVKQDVFNYYVGSYQPVQKWLKDRKGSLLSELDVKTYIKIIEAVEASLEIVGEIDKILIV